ncbi:RNA polymerase sigma factor SigZ [Ktedonobacter racemifer]|uniref:RNA polymerase sigma factor SigZ n=1 Tax=Ktedonobacter racemifer DSM 44963 TaxID=485913 RepID=D6TS21_KTERA|nr:RNA polymerase sigma factor SigZ [Ktedonobacter racemifer]EFH86094.1 RNA polymerase, sigma-24 subunit, ECF subfamily [Ktedonobacter racemifer DSM 44963]
MVHTIESAWQTLHDPLYRFILRRVATEEQAEDLLQEVFLKMHTQVDSLREHDKLESWMYQIARNLIIDHYRKRRQDVPLEDAEEMLPLDEIPEENVQAQLAASVAAMIACLPPAYQEALLLTDMQGLSQKELATRLGLSFSGAKSRVQRAREKLKQVVLDCCHIEFDRLGRVIDYYSHCTCCQTQEHEKKGRSTERCACTSQATCASSQANTILSVIKIGDIGLKA